MHSKKLSGILNGVDYEEWNPETGPYQVAHYSARDLSGKLASKKALLAGDGLAAECQRPLIGIVSRFADQKGFDLVEGIAAWLADQDVALVALGSGQKKFEDMFRELAALRPDKFAVRIGYDDALSHRIEAGADMFLMPSQYEPCGLSQIYSLRYGTVPIVRATGGLDDTVDESTGFKFVEYTPEALAGGDRAGARGLREAGCVDRADAAGHGERLFVGRVGQGISALYRSLLAARYNSAPDIATTIPRTSEYQADHRK